MLSLRLVWMFCVCFLLSTWRFNWGGLFPQCFGSWISSPCYQTPLPAFRPTRWWNLFKHKQTSRSRLLAVWLLLLSHVESGCRDWGDGFRRSTKQNSPFVHFVLHPVTCPRDPCRLASAPLNKKCWREGGLNILLPKTHKMFTVVDTNVSVVLKPSGAALYRVFMFLNCCLLESWNFKYITAFNSTWQVNRLSYDASFSYARSRRSVLQLFWSFWLCHVIFLCFVVTEM